MRSRMVAGALAFPLGLAALPAPAAEGSFLTAYDVSLIGLPIGRASFRTEIAKDSYSVDGTLASSGLADILTTVKGTSSVEGRIAGNRLYATRYAIDYGSGKKSYKSNVSFKGGRVTAASVRPEANRTEAYIAVKPDQLRSVVDPLSGLMIKPVGGKASAICDRTLKFYDGWSRVDLTMTPGGTKPISVKGFSGDATVCNVRIKPVSGYKVTSSGVKYITAQTVQIWFAPIGSTGVYAPVYARVPTKIGPLTFRASTFANP